MTARVTMPTASRRLIVMSGEDNSMTGSSVQADIDHSDSQAHAGEGRDQSRRQQHRPERERRLAGARAPSATPCP